MEEPETFLHENFQEYFHDVLKDIAENNQVIYTTHSKKFVDIFDYRTIVKCALEDGATSIIQQVELIAIDPLLQDTAFSDLHYPEDFTSFMKSVEPSLWILCFSKKVVIVEWPHDVLAYNLALENWWESVIKWGLAFNNISIIPVHWKDLIVIISKICKSLKIPYFIIHDYDLADTVTLDLNETIYNDGSYKTTDPYTSLNSNEKQQYTKNLKIYHNSLWVVNIHINKPNLEWVLWFTIIDPANFHYRNKWCSEIFSKLNNKTTDEIKAEFPGFLPDSLVDFIIA